MIIDLTQTIGETAAYDKKADVETRKPKRWRKQEALNMTEELVYIHSDSLLADSQQIIEAAQQMAEFCHGMHDQGV